MYNKFVIFNYKLNIEKNRYIYIKTVNFLFLLLIYFL